MAGEQGEQSKRGAGEFVVPDYNSMNPEQLIAEAQKVTTKAEVGRLFSFLAARLTDPSRTDRDITLATLQVLTTQREKLTQAPERNNDMVFEGTNPVADGLSDVDRTFVEMTGVDPTHFGPNEKDVRPPGRS